MPTRHLILVLGDQLDANSAAFDDFDKAQDRVWMAENEEEATHVWCHKLRLVFFFSAMRHFREDLKEAGFRVEYHELSTQPSKDRGNSFAELLTKSVNRFHPEKLIVVQPGDYRVQESLKETAESLNVELEIRADRHFYCGIEEFNDWAAGRKRIVMEDFYRQMRKQQDLLMDDGQPVGGDWNYDKDNRETFGKQGPGDIKTPRSFRPDEITSEVIEMVEQRYAEHPGTTEHFDYPVTKSQARAALRDFIKYRLHDFGEFEDAMWTERAFLYHSRLSAILNIHLLDPRDCVKAAIEAYESGDAPINSVEGFVRQIVGWREFICGIYWREMPKYIQRNALRTGDVDVPQFFWDGDTSMNCIRECMQSVLNHGYAHHIQRLMVLGLFSLLAGVHPRKFHDWHMAMYVDAIDWVSLPNTLGMSQYGDGGIVGTKPYCASGNYINKMSNYCKGCQYNYKEATGEDACPVTTLYWDFLDRHHEAFKDNRRMTFQVKNLEKKSEETLAAIRTKAQKLKEAVRNGERI